MELSVYNILISDYYVLSDYDSLSDYYSLSDYHVQSDYFDLRDYFVPSDYFVSNDYYALSDPSDFQVILIKSQKISKANLTLSWWPQENFKRSIPQTSSFASGRRRREF